MYYFYLKNEFRGSEIGVYSHSARKGSMQLLLVWPPALGAESELRPRSWKEGLRIPAFLFVVLLAAI